MRSKYSFSMGPWSKSNAFQIWYLWFFTDPIGPNMKRLVPHGTLVEIWYFRFFTVPWSKYDTFGCSWYLGRSMILSFFHSTLVQSPKEGKQMGERDGSPVSSCTKYNESYMIVRSVRSSNSHPDLLVTHPHFFRSHRSSTLDYHFLSHYSYIKAIMLYKGNHWTRCAGFMDASWVRLGINNDCWYLYFDKYGNFWTSKI